MRITGNCGPRRSYRSVFKEILLSDSASFGVWRRVESFQTFPRIQWQQNTLEDSNIAAFALLGYELDGPGFETRQRQRIFCLFHKVHAGRVGHESSCVIGTGIVTLSKEPPVGWSWPRCIYAASGAKVTNKWSAASFPLYVFMTTSVFHLPFELYFAGVVWVFVEETGDRTEREKWELICISYLNYCLLDHGTAYCLLIPTFRRKLKPFLSFLVWT